MVQTRALYNLLRLNKEEDPSLKAPDWAVEDYRSLDLNALFSRLRVFGVQLDKSSFHEFGGQCDTPEELGELLFPDERNQKKRDAFYLVVFELWRRLLPEKQSLSIFFDELDFQIRKYDEDVLESDEPIQDALANLLEILEENTDHGVQPKDVFRAVTDYCAHDVESFIYDYISDLLDSENEIYASELIEEFYPYVTEILWFDFLRIRLMSFTEIGLANQEMHKLLNHTLKLPLLFEVIQFLSTTGEHELFKFSVKKALVEIQDKEELLEIMSMIADYYRGLDEDDKEKKVQGLLSAMEEGPLDSKDLKMLQALLV